MAGGISNVMAGFGLGVALAGAPGPVQAVLLGESIRGGIRRGFRAMAGASMTFALLLVALALGLSVAAPTGTALRILKVAGGALLLWLAVEGFRSAHRLDADSAERRSLPPAVRGALAVLLNPGAWLFLGAVASPRFATATLAGGTATAVLVAVALVIGLALGDGAVVLLGGLGVRRAGERLGLWVRRVLAMVLAGLGLWLLIGGVMSS
jgi:threonine/homoserine/homoserine lactone efflux protein